MEVASVEPLSAAFSVDGRLLATVTREPTVRIWDVQSGAHVREVKHGTDGAPWCAAFSPDGRFFAVGNWTKTIGIWDARSWEFHGDLLGHTQLVSSLSFEPGLGEPLLASTSYDGTIKLWNVEELRCLCTLEANAWEAYSVDFLPDGKSLVSAHADGTIGFWDLTYYDSHIVGNASYQLRKLSMEQNAGFDLDRARRAVAKLQTRRIAPEP
jgi:WD40 repeat protein